MIARGWLGRNVYLFVSSDICQQSREHVIVIQATIENETHVNQRRTVHSLPFLWGETY
jgi:hypothetical protein